MTAPAIRRYPTKLHIICSACGHQAQVHTFLDKPLRLKCRQCGSRDAIVATRDRLRIWSRQRRGK
jgi:hypothetical protein